MPRWRWMDSALDGHFEFRPRPQLLRVAQTVATRGAQPARANAICFLRNPFTRFAFKGMTFTPVAACPHLFDHCSLP